MKPAPHAEKTERTAPDPSGAATVIGRGFSFRLGAQAVSALINVVGIVLLGGYLAADGYGQYAFYYALVPLIASLSDLGVGVIITREVARERALGARYLGDAILIKGLVSATLLLIVALSAPRLLDPAAALLMILVTAAGLIDISQDVGVWVYRAHDRQDLESLVLLTGQVMWLAGIGLCALLKLPVAFAIGVATLAFGLRLLVGAIVLARTMYLPRFVPDWRRLRSLIAEGLPFGLAMFTVVLYGRVGVLLLKALATDADVAYFNIGYMLSQPFGFISSALSISAFPSLARRARLGPDRIGPLVQRTLKYQLVMALPLAVGLALLSDRVIPFLFHGGSFLKAGDALRILSLGLPLIFLNLTARYLLAALDAQRSYLRAIGLGLAVNVALSAALARPLGFSGACVGLLGGELAVFLMCQRTLGRYMRTTAVLRELGRPAIAAAGMGLVLSGIRSGNLVVLPVVGAAVYVLLLVVLNVVGHDELQMLRGVYVSFGLPGSGHLMKARNHP